jgi:hypothetical protein
MSEDKDPCWKNYKMVGTKKKGSKTVPNCVPKEGREQGVAEGSDQKKPLKTHKSGCGYNYGHDCDCGGTLTHASDCHYNYGHDCDCGLDKLKQQKQNNKKQGVAKGLNEFAPDGFGGDDGEGFDPDMAKMAHEEGFRKGVSLAMVATLERAMEIGHWHKRHGGMYKHYFAKGFKEGRLARIRQDNKQYDLNLQLNKDGSVSHGEQDMAEGFPHDVDHMPGKTIKHQGTNCTTCHGRKSMYKLGGKLFADNKQGAEKVKCPTCKGTGDKKGVAEATALPASTRELKGQELTDYLDRIRNQEKKKTDKYNLPYVHRSSVVGYYNADGKKYNTDAIKAGLKERPKSLLKKNEKMKHSDGAQEQFFNIGFAALVGIALDENTNELIVVNTCPGAGSCKVDCFAMKGGKVQFAGPWLSDGRILTYLLNHPDEFFEQLTQEISKEEAKGKKGGYSVSIRWHDAGDFFSPEYMNMAFDLANSLPNVKFYAYTKVAKAAMANKPSNFIINWSEGASTSQEKQIKRNDPNLDTTKNSRIVPSSLFYDLLVKDEKKNLIKGPEGQWQVIPDELPELKQRLADKYGISKNSILSYDEWNTKGKNNKSMKWNVIVAPGEPDLTANDPGVLGTLLLKH